MTIPLALLLLTIGCGEPAPAPDAAGESPSPAAQATGTNELALHVVGQFRTQGQADVNMINAPITAWPVDAGPVPDVSLIELVNSNKDKVFDSVLVEKGFNVRRVDAHPGPVGPPPGEDRSFYLRLQLAGDNGLGGYHHGLDMHAELYSLHRAPDVVVGRSSARMDQAETDEEHVAALREAFAQLVDEAMTGLQASYTEEERRPRAELTLRFDSTGIDALENAWLRESLLPCLLDQGTTLGHHNIEELGWKVTYRLKKHDLEQTEADYLTWYADVMKHAAGPTGKHTCSLWRSPLSGRITSAEVDTERSMITLSWSEKEPE